MSTNEHLTWAETFMAALAAAGVRDVVVCPGSRSTPLALAADVTAGLRIHTAVDERAAAFFALGQARVTRLPSAVLCTSGTAGAHFTPAVIEASQSHVPLLLVTADRPWEAVDVAASQTIDQTKLFGAHVRFFVELGLPDLGAPREAPARVALHAAARTLGPDPGPVHVNARFRKPLEPSQPWPDADRSTRLTDVLRRGTTRVFAPRTAAPPEALEALAELASHTERGLIVCGPAPVDRPEAPLREAAVALARATGFPLLAETTSQARFGSAAPDVVACAAFDTLLRDPAFAARHAPDLLIELGAPATSQGYADYLAKHPTAARYVIAPHGWNDPSQDATALVLADPAETARALAARLGPARRSSPSLWAESFRRADALAWSLAEAHASAAHLTEAAVARLVIAGCPADALFSVGNSLPVRDVDLWAPPRPSPLGVLHQRGASGIDGLVASAAGAATVAGRPVVLLLGDTSVLHDLTSLALARRAPVPLVVVVVQNQGGRIFERLPIARAVDVDRFDKYFTMHEPVDLAPAAAAFGVRFARTDTESAFVRAFAEALKTPGATLIEAVVPPDDGRARVTCFRSELAATLAREDLS
ncbi:2-succinyl-5-enolpyruvyl-6-hydroxy-3-cyclohexene-1-carboxylic-acid synthase [Polyangium mundeleinium]|uniref:2-succinyl-5-enolpyruvyl-6-hydroxy-3-cyclohexene-1-carboxylate synthase n=1 Tax=Polyangium mundeleinium TaxID=2995306 RepID=A0ABT5ER08_9BACT|nr:2-succinyl-5-enolpyruvyl-6-hydroxy-3-cyclohexene-1-carboxylic-acid synthase [Polyangium mundeleinium]MDC0744278.1 2-succinyl-5-enolpyruvyl-6-hydroxy-3-cyclohexene-1-carboxylic-acid synthase [Polyangium mundeleinium]